MNKEQREQLASDLMAEAEHRRGRVVDLLRNAAAALSAPDAQQTRQPGQVVWVNPEEFDLCQTKPIIMDEHNELLNGMPRDIAAFAARSDHCCLALAPVTPPAAQVQGEREAFESRFANCCLKRDGDGKYFDPCIYSAWNAWQARAALSAPPAAGVPEIACPVCEGRRVIYHPHADDDYRCEHCDGSGSVESPTTPASEQQQAVVMSAAAADVLTERQRQISAEDFDAVHDDMATGGQLGDAAACYALWAGGINPGNWYQFWPWAREWLKHSNPRRMLVKAGALILAEIERLDRKQQAEPSKGGDA